MNRIGPSCSYSHLLKAEQAEGRAWSYQVTEALALQMRSANLSSGKEGKTSLLHIRTLDKKADYLCL